VNDVDDLMSNAVVLKTSSKTTLSLVYVSVLKAVASVKRPDDVTLDWMYHSADPSALTPAQSYVALLRKLWGMSISLPSSIMGSLLASLLASLKNDTLAFLAGFWNCIPAGIPSGLSKRRKAKVQAQTNVEGTHILSERKIAFAALQYAAAILETYGDDGNCGIDFQAILPSLLVALQAPTGDHAYRTSAMKCIQHMCKSAKMGTFKTIYAFDGIYGERAGTLSFSLRPTFLFIPQQ
jgi:hypothetical protein